MAETRVREMMCTYGVLFTSSMAASVVVVVVDVILFNGPGRPAIFLLCKSPFRLAATSSSHCTITAKLARKMTTKFLQKCNFQHFVVRTFH